jgi:hypothetical protein
LVISLLAIALWVIFPFINPVGFSLFISVLVVLILLYIALFYRYIK